jgi:purine nucleosidase
MPAILIDTDIGDDIDDALALALALRSPELEVLGISTVFGDVTLRARLAQKLLCTFGRPDMPVAAGAALPLALRNQPSGCIQGAAVAPDEPLPPLYQSDVTTFISTMGLSRPGQVTLVCLGPLTNVAAAFVAEPALAGALAGIVMMGTAAFPWAEWNTRNDPEAARIVFQSGVPLCIVGLNVTLRCPLPLAAVRALAQAGHPETDLLSQLIALWQRGNARRRPFLHDPLAVAAIARPDLLRLAPARVGIIQRGPLRGWGCAWPWLGSTAQIATQVKRQAFLQMFTTRVGTTAALQNL